MPSNTEPTDVVDPSPRRRWWRPSSVSHATVVAYLALFMAMGGTAAAATGGTFVLGKRNDADAVSTLSSSTGTPLLLRSPKGTAPLAVNRTVKVAHLNTDLLDGLDSTGFLRLGRGNSGARTTLDNPAGVPLRLRPGPGSAPLQVGSSVKVDHLNADLLDGMDASAFVPRAELEALQAQVTTLQTDHATLQADHATLAADHAALAAKVDELAANEPGSDTELAARVAELESLLAEVTRVEVDGHPTVRFSGVNLQVVNGTGTTGGGPNGRGNLLVGYSASRVGGAAPRTGSHYLIVGDEHSWTSHGGVLAGFRNTATAPWATVTGGRENRASGWGASVTGGTGNRASANDAAVVGGRDNLANTWASAVSGGRNNTAGVQDSSYYCFVDDCGYSSVSGGVNNLATGRGATVSGGEGNRATGPITAVNGGYANTAGGAWTSVLGGSSRDVTAEKACHPDCS
jgi:hypothetical protein